MRETDKTEQNEHYLSPYAIPEIAGFAAWSIAAMDAMLHEGLTPTHITAMVLSFYYTLNMMYMDGEFSQPSIDFINSRYHL